jgi:hypothetical protein
VDEADHHTVETQPKEAEQSGSALRGLARLSLGTAVVAVEAATDWLRQLDQESIQVPPEQRDADSVLIPAEEWETTLGHEMAQPPRHLLVGMTLATQARLGRIATSLRGGADALGSAFEAVSSPLRTSRVLSPARGGFEDLVERGQSRVTRWREMGRAEEARGRVLAQNALDQLIDDSAEAVTGDPRFEALIQKVLAEQSMGMAAEAIDEVRERTITGDILVERPVRALLRRPPRKSVPASTEVIKNLPKPIKRG